MALDGFFYPQLTYGPSSTVISFASAQGPHGEGVVVTPTLVPSAMKSETISLSGQRETLWYRRDLNVVLVAQFVDPALLTELGVYCDTWGLKGKQAALVLSTTNCSGQPEYDQANAFFTLAELVTPRFEPKRTFPSRALFTIQLEFRQGQ